MADTTDKETPKEEIMREQLTAVLFREMKGRRARPAVSIRGMMLAAMRREIPMQRIIR